MNRKQIIKKLQDYDISFSKKDNTNRLQKKLQKYLDSKISYGVKAFRKLSNNLLQTGGVGGSQFVNKIIKILY